MKAIIETGGKQYNVSVGDVIYIEKLVQVLEKISEKTKFLREIIKKYYLNLTEDLLDMYGEDIKDELDDCYKDFDDLYNTVESIREEDPLERIKEELQNITDEELREELESL